MRTKSGVRGVGAVRKADMPCRVISQQLQVLKRCAEVSMRSVMRSECLLVEIRGAIKRDARREAVCKAM